LRLALLLSTRAGVAVLLPWLSGDTPCPWQTILGYGFACGQVLTTLVIRACFAAKLGLSFGATATVLAFIATVGLALALWIRKRRKVTAALVQFQIQMPEQGLASLGLAFIRCADTCATYWACARSLVAPAISLGCMGDMGTQDENLVRER
jgi:uncharacterized membrane protein